MIRVSGIVSTRYPLLWVMFKLTSSPLTMPLYFPNTVIMQDPTNPLPIVLSETSTNTSSSSTTRSLSPQLRRQEAIFKKSVTSKEVKLDMLSPHLFRLYIVWENGIAVRPDVALMWRGMTPNNSEAWSIEEDNIMRRYYPEKPQIEVMRALPRWAWNRILERAQDLNLRRKVSHNGPHPFNSYHRTMRYDDLMAAEQLAQGEEEKERIRYIVNKLAQQTMRGGLSAYWFLPLDSISYTGLDAALEDEAEKLYVSAFPYGAPRPA